MRLMDSKRIAATGHHSFEVGAYNFQSISASDQRVWSTRLIVFTAHSHAYNIVACIHIPTGNQSGQITELKIFLYPVR